MHLAKKIKQHVCNFFISSEIRELCEEVYCVHLGESFPTSIYLQKSSSIQPRTSPSKFGGNFNALFICLLSGTTHTACRAALCAGAIRRSKMDPSRPCPLSERHPCGRQTEEQLLRLPPPPPRTHGAPPHSVHTSQGMLRQ